MFFNDDPEYTKYGYYLIDGVKTFSKFEAYQLSGKDWSKVKFIYNDDILSTYDWTVEPEDDIYELYKQRAEQLRNRYDYLVLMYSGGIDSHTILETFLQNKIHLNEICTFSSIDIQGKKGQLNQEVSNKVMPFVELLDLKKIGTKFRYVEIGNLLINQWNDEFSFENFQHYNTGAQWFLTRTHVFKSGIKEHVQLTEEGKTVCYIWGLDKPSLFIDENTDKFIYRYVDLANDFGSKKYVNYNLINKKLLSFYDETFYITRDLPKIVIKQCHLLKNWIKQVSSSDPRLQLYQDIPTNGPWVPHSYFKENDKKIYKFLHKKTVDGILYPNSNLMAFGDDKTRGSVIFSEKEKWFIESNHENSTKYNQKIRQLVKSDPYYFAYKQSDNVLSEPFFKDEKYINLIPKKPQPIFSKIYRIEK